MPDDTGMYDDKLGVIEGATEEILEITGTPISVTPIVDSVAGVDTVGDGQNLEIQVEVAESSALTTTDVDEKGSMLIFVDGEGNRIHGLPDKFVSFAGVVPVNGIRRKKIPIPFGAATAGDLIIICRAAKLKTGETEPTPVGNARRFRAANLKIKA